MKHYVEENNRVLDFVAALQEKNFVKAGTLLTASHVSLSKQYEVSCEELDFLANRAVSLEGCTGSRIMGGGFGGCTINLVKESSVGLFCEKISELYQTAFGIVPEINLYHTVEGGRVEIHSNAPVL